MNIRTVITGSVAAGALAWSATAVHAEMKAQQDEVAPPAQDSAAQQEAGFLGVGVVTAAAPGGVELKAPVLEVAAVHPGSAAEDAGVRTGDMLVRLDDQRLVHPSQLSALVAAIPPGHEIELAVWRDGKTQTLTTTLGQRPAELQQAAPQAFGQPLQPGTPPAFGQMPDLRLFQAPEDFGPMQLEELDPDQVQQRMDAMMKDMDQRMQEMRRMLEQQQQQEQQQGEQPRVQPRGNGAGAQLLDELDVPAGQGAIRSSVQVFQYPEHRLTIRHDANGRHLKATDARGNVIYDGPIETDDQLQQVPDAVREKLPEVTPLQNRQAQPQQPVGQAV